MSKPRDGGMAFPFQFVSSPDSEDYPGMSLRDYFAGQVIGLMIELIVDDRLKPKTDEGCNVAETAAHTAYELADAMLAERERAR